jgi:diaminohydroxyphosphoribosylaminopyrimidine deaminase/5-amino-6-(5-phosphoribosylamino)uracil reductase
MSTPDEKYMARALTLAARGKGMVSPNPLVGAVIVKDRKIIAEGFHASYGGDHAEAAAIKSSKETVKGATLYCNLEPCCHSEKQTPPCAQRLIKEGIGRLVIAGLDPNPKVAGKGVELLKKYGIQVTTGILEQENLNLNRFYYHFVKTGTPYVTIKIARSVDGFISDDPSRSFRLTGKESVARVHTWRSEYDAVLVGAGTVNIDNPQLTVRAVKGRNPAKVILSGNLSVKAHQDIFSGNNNGNTILITAKGSDPKLILDLRDRGVQVLEVEKSERGYIAGTTILKILAISNITSVLIEGGSRVFSHFIKEKTFNAIQIFIAPKILGQGVKDINIAMDQSIRLQLNEVEMLGNDLLLSYQL